MCALANVVLGSKGFLGYDLELPVEPQMSLLKSYGTWKNGLSTMKYALIFSKQHENSKDLGASEEITKL